MKHWILLLPLFLLPHFGWAQALGAVHLQCDYKENPLGIDNSAPRLSWELAADARGTLQTAYRILVADNLQALQDGKGNIWDSKKIASSASIQVPCTGKPLLAGKTYWWTVMVWDNRQHVSTWSSPASWRMGLLTASDWQGAKWIGYEALTEQSIIVPYAHGKGLKEWGERRDVLPLLRKEFTVHKPVKRATMFICGLGQFEWHLNGAKVGDHFLDPAWTQFDKEAQYVTFDVTASLKQGVNAIGVMLGNGFYYIPGERYRKLTGGFGFPKMICRMVIEYRDGSAEDIISDASWKTAPGPVTFSSIYGGEDYDAGMERSGWDSPYFNDQLWREAVIIPDKPVLKSQAADPLKVMATFTPLKITKPDSGEVYVYDMGQNASGIPQITVRGKKGDTVRIAPAELVGRNGLVSQKNTGSPVYYTYVLNGSGTETWQPRFSYIGFRYLQVERAVPIDAPNPHQWPEIMALKALHTRNAAQSMGTFSSSSNLFNRTDTLIDWAIRSNMASIFTDCPHRERLGWLEEVHLMGNSMHYHYDILPLCRKAVHDMMTAQTPEGLVPTITPEYHHFGEVFRDSPEWGSSSILVPWYVYQWYGDRDLLTESYPMMQRYIAYLKRRADSTGGILTYGLSDWYDLGPKPPGFCQLTTKGITATAIYYYDLDVISRVARLLGKNADAVKYQNLAATIKTAYNKAFFHPDTKQYGTGSQAGNAISVYTGLVPPADKAAVIANIIKDIRDHNNTLTAGDIGYRYLLKVLAEAGRSDVIFDMNNREDVPGYGYQLAHGATALTESWQGLPSVSNNHLMLGHLMEWFCEGLAGIQPAAGAVAYKEIVIRPEPVGDIQSARGSFHSPYGLIATDWKRKGTAFELSVTIPANTAATIYLPAPKGAAVTEGNKPLSGRTDVAVKGYEQDRTLVKVGSGTYHFIVHW